MDEDRVSRGAASQRTLPPVLQWTLPGRALVLVLSATSIGCLLAEFYGLCAMRTFTFAVLFPATLALAGIALLDRARGDRRLWRAVCVGALGGFWAAVAYDLFRLPFVLAAVDRLGPEWLRLPLFKVFPRFGALILGEAFTPTQTDAQFTLGAHLAGWTYHFSNGIAFGVMYMALIGAADRRSWWWAVAFATGLELAMLLTPYATYFGIHATARFVTVTMTAHLVFGVALGRQCRRSGFAGGEEGLPISP